MRWAFIFLFLPEVAGAQYCNSFQGYGDTILCDTGVPVQLDASPGFTDYNWSPASGLSDPTLPNPVATASSTTSYVVSATGVSANLIPNGDFSLGNTGFSTGMNYAPFYAPGNCYVGPDWFNYTFGLSDHSPGSDNYYMQVDGAGRTQTAPAL